jgi:hypothetical protein
MKLGVSSAGSVRQRAEDTSIAARQPDKPDKSASPLCVLPSGCRVMSGWLSARESLCRFA